MILGYKCDVENKRQVSKERGETLARENSCQFLEISAKTGINVEKAFIDLANAILVKTPYDPNRKGIDITHSETMKTWCC